MADCEHMNFRAQVNVARIEDVKRFAADVTIECADCHEPFVFLGLPFGLSPRFPTTNPIQTEARMPIAPSTEIVPKDSYPGFLHAHHGQKPEAAS